MLPTTKVTPEKKSGAGPEKYDTDSPDTREQAEELLKQYYKQEKATETEQAPNKLPKRPRLLSHRLREDGVMIVVDGASGRKLEFEPKDYQANEQEQAEDAEQEALDAEAEAAEARAQTLVAEEKAKAAKAKAKAAAKSFGPKGATEAANKKRDAEAKAKAGEQ